MKYKSYYDIFIYPIVLDLDFILQKVSKAAGYKIEALKTKSRKRELVETRQAYFILARQLTDNTLEEIGKLIPRDYATVLHAQDNAHLPSIKKIIAKTNLL